MKNGHASLMIVALAVSAVSASAFQTPEKRAEGQKAVTQETQDKASLWMKHKLVATQKILDGMTRGDFEEIAKNAESMQVMGFLEGWVRADVEGYKPQLLAFDHANAAIVRAAKEKNLDGVTIAYTQLAITCVQCHKIVRDKPIQ